jgi:hypothetical protein
MFKIDYWANMALIVIGITRIIVLGVTIYL